MAVLYKSLDVILRRFCVAEVVNTRDEKELFVFQEQVWQARLFALTFSCVLIYLRTSLYQKSRHALEFVFGSRQSPKVLIRYILLS